MTDVLEHRLVLSSFYAAPTGSTTGDGSLTRPWDLATALKSSSILPGDTLWLRGGTYNGVFRSNLTGSPQAPIQVRQVPGEHATLDNGTTAPSQPNLEIYGAYTWFHDFEVTDSYASRVYATNDESVRGTGINVYAPGTKLIDLVIHDTDTAVGMWSNAIGAEAYGNLIYNAGIDGPDRGHGHGIYSQNAIGAKLLDNNIIFNQFSMGIQVYGSAAAALDNFTLQGNTLFNNGVSSTFGAKRNIEIGGEPTANDPHLLNNITYFSPGVGGDNNLGYTGGTYRAILTGNTFAGGDAALNITGGDTNASITNNTFLGSTPGLNPTQAPNNSYLTTPPTASQTVVEPDPYEPGRANITVANWALLNSVAVDLSKVLTPGATYEIHDAQNFYGPPVVAGTYSGGLINLPMNLTTAAQPIGGPVVVPHTSKQFNAFVLLSTPPTTTTTPAPTPQTVVLDGFAPLTNATSSVAFGTTVAGAPLTHTFTVENLGQAELDLGAIALPAGFSLVAAPTATKLAYGGSTSFTVRFDAAAAATSAAGTVSLATNDPAASPFTFTVTAATEAATVHVVDDSDPGFTTAGSWTTITPQGFRSDDQYSAPGTGSSTASWTFTGLTPGQYRVAATWTPFGNRATNAPYTVLNATTPLATVAVNQQLTPAGLSDQGAAWQDLGGPYTITGTTLTVQLSNNANNYVIADAVRIERLTPQAPAPQIQVANGSTPIANSTGSVAFGSTPIGIPLTQTFTLTNSGSAPLTLGAISLPAGFALAAPFAATTVPAAGSTSFAIQFTAAAAGSSAGVVSFATNDPNNNPFSFAVAANATAVAAAPVATAPVSGAVQVMDDTDSRFSVVGAWKTSTDGQGFGSDVRYSAAGTGTNTASWTFSGLTPGQYRVSATWSPFSNRATNAPYTVLDGTAVVGAVTVNQQATPVGFSDQGAAWQDLGGPYTINGTTLTVQLSDNANNYVIADAVRIERIGNLASAPQVQVANGSTPIAANATAVTAAPVATAPVSGAVQVMDDTDSRFSVAGPWTPFAGQGFGSEVHYSAAGSGASTASWTFSGLTPGKYRVSATWTPFSNRATNAPYTVLDGTTVVGAVTVNQQATPVGFTDQGAAWQDLGGAYTINGTTLTVRLANNANGYVIADAIRIERIA